MPYVQNKSSPDFLNGLSLSQNLGAFKKKKTQRYLPHLKYSFSSFSRILSENSSKYLASSSFKSNQYK